MRASNHIFVILGWLWSSLPPPTFKQLVSTWIGFSIVLRIVCLLSFDGCIQMRRTSNILVASCARKDKNLLFIVPWIPPHPLQPSLSPLLQYSCHTTTFPFAGTYRLSRDTTFNICAAYYTVSPYSFLKMFILCLSLVERLMVRDYLVVATTKKKVGRETEGCGGTSATRSLQQRESDSKWLK